MSPMQSNLNVAHESPNTTFLSLYATLKKYHNTLLPSKILHQHVSSFSWDHCKSQEKIKPMRMQNFGGQTTDIMVFLIVAH